MWLNGPEQPSRRTPRRPAPAWNSDQIAEGHALVRQCLALNRPGPYQIQAAINAVHTDAADAALVDWSQVVALYDQLAALTPSPIVALTENEAERAWLTDRQASCGNDDGHLSGVKRT